MHGCECRRARSKRNNPRLFNTIGGTTPGDRNIISGNPNYGLSLGGQHNTVMGNDIGTDARGTNPLGNGSSGLGVSGFGGLHTGRDTIVGNVIAANQGYGIDLGGDLGGKVVQANFIGTDATGLHPLGNTSTDVNDSSNGNTIGGSTAALGNVITANGGYGVTVSGGSGNAILSNSIFGNTTTGISFGIFQLLEGASDPDGDTLTVARVDATSNPGGTIERNGNQVDYTPPPNLGFGEDFFVYAISGGVNTVTAKVIILVELPPNQVAVPDAYHLTPGEHLVIAAPGVLANDKIDESLISAVVELVSPPKHAAAFALHSDGSFSYTPKRSFTHGTDSFTYRLTIPVSLFIGQVEETNTASVLLSDGKAPKHPGQHKKK
jgi:hypothetical protein